MSTAASAASAEIVIRPPAAMARIDFRELVQYRHLFAALVRRHVRLQFAELRLAWLWPCVRPLSRRLLGC